MLTRSARAFRAFITSRCSGGPRGQKPRTQAESRVGNVASALAIADGKGPFADRSDHRSHHRSNHTPRNPDQPELTVDATRIRATWVKQKRKRPERGTFQQLAYGNINRF